MENVWHLMSPVGVRRERTTAQRSASSAERIVGFLSNRKPNASLLMTTLMTRLKERGYNTRFYEKLNAATPAGDKLLEKIARECTSVVVASGD